jgi:tyrosine-protein phosphatase YwqE
LPHQSDLEIREGRELVSSGKVKAILVEGALATVRADEYLVVEVDEIGPGP